MAKAKVLKGGPLVCATVLQANNRLGWTCLPGTNPPAYFANWLKTKNKILITWGPSLLVASLRRQNTQQNDTRHNDNQQQQIKRDTQHND